MNHFDSTRAFLAKLGPRSETQFTLFGRTFVQHAEVFPAARFPSTELFTSLLPFETGMRFLDMGCGVGVASVMAAAAGCSVTAVDINPDAVANTARNAALHGVGHLVTAIQSDLFSAISEDAQFDLVFWNSNFVRAPAEYPCHGWFEHAFFDPGYATHDRFLHAVKQRAAKLGRVLLGFSELGDRAWLDRTCESLGLRVATLAVRRGVEDEDVMFQLLEIIEGDADEVG